MRVVIVNTYARARVELNHVFLSPVRKKLYLFQDRMNLMVSGIWNAPKEEITLTLVLEH